MLPTERPKGLYVGQEIYIFPSFTALNFADCISRSKLEMFPTEGLFSYTREPKGFIPKVQHTHIHIHIYIVISDYFLLLLRDTSRLGLEFETCAARHKV